MELVVMFSLKNQGDQAVTLGSAVPNTQIAKKVIAQTPAKTCNNRRRRKIGGGFYRDGQSCYFKTR